MKSMVVFGVIGLGLLMLILSGIWPTLFPGTSIWTEEKAARWAVVKDKLHNLAFIVDDSKPVKMHGGPDIAKAKAEFEQLDAEGKQLKADFSRAHDRPQTVSKVLKWAGLSLAVVGVIGWYAVNQQR